MASHSYSIAIIVLLLAFAVYRRIRRNIGWQPLGRRRFIFRICIFFLIGLLFLSQGLEHPISLVSDAAGIAIGAGLAFYGFGLTKFEKRKDEQWYFQPNTWIGSAVLALFLGRLVYRMYSIYEMGLLSGGAEAQAAAVNMNQIPGATWTAGLILIMFSYYTVYFILLMRKEKHLDRMINQ